MLVPLAEFSAGVDVLGRLRSAAILNHILKFSANDTPFRSITLFST